MNTYLLRCGLLLCLLGTFLAGNAQSRNRKKDRAAASAVPDSLLPSTGPQRFHLGATARAYGDSIIVRWAPEHALLFKAAVRTGGYRLVRRTVGGGQPPVELTIKPWTVDEWKQRANRRDTIAGVCAQLVWGKTDPLRFDKNVNLSGVMSQQQQNNIRLMLALLLADENPRHAVGMGLGYVDKAVQRGKRYVYSLIALTDRTVLSSDTAVAFVQNDGPHQPADMIAVQGQGGERIARLSWSRALTEDLFSAYFIEKSVDGGRTFRRVNRRPWLQPPTGKFARVYEYTDSLARNYQPIQYRVIGMDAFGELSRPSPVVTVRGVDQTGPAGVSKLQATHQTGGRVRLTWAYSKPPGDLAGFVVAKANDSQGPFEPLVDRLLPASQREFTDDKALPHLPTYYVVIPVDTAKNAGPSLPAYCQFKDAQGPSKPKNVQGYIDSTGAVRLVWDANPEPDLLGYMVIWANDPTHVFTPKTADYLSLSVFNDQTTLNTLSKRIYYRVVAYDKNRNPSPPSDIIGLVRPDKVPPVPPVFTTYTAADTSVQLNWTRSSSEDVAHQLLLRRRQPTERWVELTKLTAAQNAYLDKSVKASSEYEYALVAVDSAGLRSPESFPLAMRTLTALPHTVRRLTARLTPDKKAVELSWQLPDQYARYLIYRAEAGKPLRSYDAVSRELTFIDKAVPKGKYEYAVKVVYQDGRESGLSNRVKIDVN